MGNLVANDKDIVVPGEEIAEGMDYLPGPGSYREGEHIVASTLGMLNIRGRALRIIPLTGKYIPKKGDILVGQVIDILFGGWRIETNSAYPAMLSMKDATSEYINRGADLTKYFTFGDYVAAKITNVTSQKLVDLSLRGPGLRKLTGGKVFTVSPNKVPRIIGKDGSMVSMIKQATGCNIVVGQNGVIWVQGTPESESLVVEISRKIEAESHISGLTNRIKDFLDKKGVAQNVRQDAKQGE